MECHIFAGFRGKELMDALPGHIHMHVFPGRKIGKLGEIAHKVLANDRIPKLVYFIPDLTDVTTKRKEACFVNNKKKRYCEIKLNERVENDGTALIVADMEYIANSLRRRNCHVVFATFVTMCLKAWNELQLQQGFTSYLRHSESYPVMQEKLNSFLYKLNKEIAGINSHNGVITPFIHSFVQKGQSQNYRYDYTRFKDGIHLEAEVVDKWVEYLINHVEKNIDKINGKKRGHDQESLDSKAKKKRYD